MVIVLLFIGKLRRWRIFCQYGESSIRRIIYDNIKPTIRDGCFQQWQLQISLFTSLNMFGILHCQSSLIISTRINVAVNVGPRRYLESMV